MHEQDSISTSKKWILTIMAILLVSTVTLSIAEVAIRLLLPNPAKQSSPDSASKQTLTKALTEYHDTLGWFLKPSTELRHQGPEFDVVVRTNSHGFRANKDYSYEKAPGKKRILAIGDSFTFGHGVGNDETYTAFLEDLIPNTEVINLGVSAYGTDQQLLVLETKGLKYHPDVVILGFYKGDIFRNDDLFHNLLPKPMYKLEHDGNLVLTHVPVPKEKLNVQNLGLGHKLLRKSRLYRILSARGRWLLEHLGYGEAWDITEAILRNMDKTAHQANAKFLVLIFPNEGAIYGNSLVRFIQSRTIMQMRALLQRNNIEYIDLTQMFLRQVKKRPNERLYYKIDGHPKPIWHKLVAHTVYQHILTSKSLQDRKPG
ncbi:MAG: hypothetical protein AMJ92_07020 [candidate division Zixibacteria bacterium SM23_81]|nr:MAG: hypothetical protein AMJ92_07020 [candidate division Zixibacteria bacterium SM23_81]